MSVLGGVGRFLPGVDQDDVMKKHIIPALTDIASAKWHGKGCRRHNCGTVCLCAPCHARVALEKMGLR